MTQREMNGCRVAPRVLLGATAAILLGFAAGCGAPEPRLVSSGEGPQVYQIGLSASNAFVVRGRGAPVLVDCGSPGDLEDIEAALRSLGIGVGDVKLAILTHGHGDHAANGKALQERGVKVAAGEAEATMTRDGHNDDLKPTSKFAAVLKPFIDYTYPPFTPDIAIPTGTGLPLEPYGISGTAVEMPGHTPGAVVVRLGAKEAIVGDMMLGGSLGGALSPGEAGEHYYQADVAKNRANLKTLLKMGIEHFYLGHGGPVTRAAVCEGFGWDPATLDDLPARRRVRGTR